MLERRDRGESRQGKGDALVHPVVLEFVLGDGLAAHRHDDTGFFELADESQVRVGYTVRGAIVRRHHFGRARADARRVVSGGTVCKRMKLVEPDDI